MIKFGCDGYFHSQPALSAVSGAPLRVNKERSQVKAKVTAIEKLAFPFQLVHLLHASLAFQYTQTDTPFKQYEHPPHLIATLTAIQML